MLESLTICTLCASILYLANGGEESSFAELFYLKCLLFGIMGNCNPWFV